MIYIHAWQFGGYTSQHTPLGIVENYRVRHSGVLGSAPERGFCSGVGDIAHRAPEHPKYHALVHVPPHDIANRILILCKHA